MLSFEIREVYTARVSRTMRSGFIATECLPFSIRRLYIRKRKNCIRQPILLKDEMTIRDYIPMFSAALLFVLYNQHLGTHSRSNKRAQKRPILRFSRDFMETMFRWDWIVVLNCSALLRCSFGSCLCSDIIIGSPSLL